MNSSLGWAGCLGVLVWKWDEGLYPCSLWLLYVIDTLVLMWSSYFIFNFSGIYYCSTVRVSFEYCRSKKETPQQTDSIATIPMYSLKLVHAFQIWFIFPKSLFFSLLFFFVNQLLWFIFTSLELCIFIAISCSFSTLCFSLCSCFGCNHYYCWAVRYRELSPDFFLPLTDKILFPESPKNISESVSVVFVWTLLPSSLVHLPVLILKLAHNCVVILHMENWLVLIQNSSIKDFFFPLENTNWFEVKLWEYMNFNFTRLMKSTQVWDAFFHCSKTLEQKVT